MNISSVGAGPLLYHICNEWSICSCRSVAADVPAGALCCTCTTTTLPDAPSK